MKPAPEHYAAALRAALALKDSAAEPSFAANPKRYAEAIADAVLAQVPEHDTPRHPAR